MERSKDDNYEAPTFGYTAIFHEGGVYMVNRMHRFVGESYTVVATNSKEAAEAAKRLLEA